MFSKAFILVLLFGMDLHCTLSLELSHVASGKELSAWKTEEGQKGKETPTLSAGSDVKEVQNVQIHKEWETFTATPEPDNGFERRLKVTVLPRNLPGDKPLQSIPESEILTIEVFVKKEATTNPIPTYWTPPNLDFSSNLPTECHYRYNTLHWRVTGTKYCDKDEHCCGCRNNKCCRPDQKVPIDDSDDKIFGSCEDDVWLCLGALIILVFVIISVITWIKKCSSLAQMSASALSDCSTNSSDNRNFLVVITKKEDKQKLLENQSVA